MKHITFIRHSRLSGPYADYGKLTFSELADLGMKRVSPHVAQNTISLIRAKFSATELAGLDLILHSTDRRTKETAQAFRKSGAKNAAVQNTSRLDEIRFDPEALTTPELFAKHGLREIRRSLFYGMKRGKGADSLKETLERAAALEQKLKGLPGERVLCITHSFFMRVLRLYFLRGKRSAREITEAALMRTLDHLNLEGFSIRL
jgi:broad specificity phosphatase PhoE